MFTDQEILDTVVRHLRKQNRPSVDPISFIPLCRYRGPDGTKCGAGCLIPDDKYNPMMEGTSTCGFYVYEALLATGYTDSQITILIAKLQQVHDGVDLYTRPLGTDMTTDMALQDKREFMLSLNFEKWKPRLLSLAKERGLSPDAILEEKAAT